MNRLKKDKGVNFEDVQKMNRSIILKLIRKYGVCTRAKLASDTGLKQASITKIVASLIEFDIVKEVGIVEGKKGRRSIGIQINTDLYKFLGVKLSRRYFSVGLYDLSGYEFEVETKKISMMNGSAEILLEMKNMVHSFLKRYANVAAIGVALPGPFLKNNEKIGLITELPGWEEVDLKQELKDEFSIPVFLEHDANAAALAEWWFGETKQDIDVMVYLLVGEGVGAGIIDQGRLFTGTQGIAGEVGHMSIDYNGRHCSCGNYGCLEKYCSTFALKEDVTSKLSIYPDSMLNSTDKLTTELIFKALDNGDPLAIEVIDRIGTYLGYGIINIVNVYNPELIVISDKMTRGGDYLLKKIDETISSRLLPSVYENLTIQMSMFKNDPPLYGAAAIAADNFLDNPTAFLE
ncbi:ROK family protein [Evansella tamaricis]|uniref:ROK family protein n=1 Tax=Evansella tamaricis TaxID=2069301 RepID=A0ABS6JA78_9BACI|nr:ROK family protein [Evansella tamaricis]MBU9710515.1 ROK family protein [Evansella tamaricis]